jgi:predicted permease
MTNFLGDSRLAIRMLGRRPGLALAAIVSLALGIGANATIYTWIQGLVLFPLPGVPDQHRIVYLEGLNPKGSAVGVSYPDFADYRQQTTMVALVAEDETTMNLATRNQVDRIYASLVSWDFFDVLGARMALGRGFVPDEDRLPDGRPVVVLSHALWEHRLDADPHVVGRTIALNGRSFTVVGVTDEAFVGSTNGVAVELWMPMAMQPSMGGRSLEKRGSRWAHVVGRLKPGATRSAAESEIGVIGARLAGAYPDTNRGLTAHLLPVWQAPDGAGHVLGPALVVLSAVVAIVLLIACANVANLLLGRALDRRREMSIRAALGASRRDLAGQLLAEGLVLASAGGAGGLLVARWSAGLLMAFLPPIDAPIRLPQSVDTGVVLFTTLVTALTALAFSLLPALEGSRADVASTLKEESIGAGGTRRKAVARNALVVAQVALSVVLLVAAGLFLRSLQNARQSDPGFDAGHVLMAGIDLFPNGYTDAEGNRFYEALLDKARALPGVRAAALARRPPLNLGGGSTYPVAVEGYQASPTEDMAVEYNCISPDYFRVMQIPVPHGREFTASDRGDAGHTVIVNETMAKRFWNADPIGRRVRINSQWATVVGVAKNITYHQFGEPRQSYMYLPLTWVFKTEAALHVKTAGDPAVVASSVREAVRALDPALPPPRIVPMSAQVRVGLMVRELSATLMGLFGGLALVLSTVGLFGVVNYLVGQGWHELGVRIALGARPSDVLTLVVRHGLSLGAVGLGIGLGASAALARLVTRQLFEVGPLDAATFVGVAAFVLAVSIAASYGPARRASRLDPIATLRHG